MASQFKNDLFDISKNDSGFRGRDLDSNFKTFCKCCKTKRTIYHVLASQKMREILCSDDVFKTEIDCPSCVVKLGEKRTARIVERLSIERANYRLNKIKTNNAYIPTVEEAQSVIDSEHKKDIEQMESDEKIDWLLKKML